MRDAVSLIGINLQIKEMNYKIKKIFFIPDNPKVLYVGLIKPDNVIVNYRLDDLLPYLIEQIKL